MGKGRNYTCPNCKQVRYYKSPQSFGAHLRKCRMAIVNFQKKVIADPKFVKPKHLIDMINSPPHYNAGSAHEVANCLKEWGLENDSLLYTAAKYIARAHKKGKLLEDLKKAQWYLNRRIGDLEKKGLM